MNVIGTADVILVTTQESLTHPLPNIIGYQWLSVHRKEVWFSGGVNSSSGVAFLIRDHPISMTTIMHSNSLVRFMWVYIKGGLDRDLFIVVCYFPSTTSTYVVHSSECDPFSDLSDWIDKFSTLRNLVILGDFNTRTIDLQAPFHDWQIDSLRTSESESDAISLQRSSDDVDGPLTRYGRHLLHLCESSALVVLNGLPCFPDIGLFTCWPHCLHLFHPLH